MMDQTPMDHIDEGTAHAWLDGALGADEAARVEAHVAACPQCEALVAEARGLIEGASRVVSALDDAPAPTIRATAPSDLPRSSLWGALRVTPGRVSIAAMLLVAAGVVFTSRSSHVLPRAQMDSTAVASTAAERTKAEPATPQSPPLTREQLSERLVAEQPVRTVERAKAAGVVVPPADSFATTGAAAASLDAASKVAVAQQTVADTRDTMRARAADRTAVRVATAAPSPAPPPAFGEAVVAARKAEEKTLSRAPVQMNVSSPASSAPRGCYRVDAVNGAGGTWGDAKLPLVIAFDTTGVVARVLSVSGEDTHARAVVMRSDADSLSFQLRRIGFSGMMALGGVGPTRKGFARSVKVQEPEHDVTVSARQVACPTP